MADDQAAAVVCDGFVQDRGLLGLLQTGEVILKGQERHDEALYNFNQILGKMSIPGIRNGHREDIITKKNNN